MLPPPQVRPSTVHGLFPVNFEGGFVFRTDGSSGNRIKQESGTYRLTCSILNANRVAILKHNYYQLGDKTFYDFLTNANDKNYAVFRKTGNNSSGMKSDVFFQYDLYVHPDETVTATVGATGYSTFSSPVPLDFAGVSGLKACVATSTDGSNVTLTRVMSAPANTGLVLNGTPNQSYSVPVTASAESPLQICW